MKFKVESVLFCIVAGLALTDLAQAQPEPALAAVNPAAAVQAQGAWARATVAGQKGTGAFMKLSSPVALRLVRAESPVAGVVEIHEMKLEGDTMRMRAMPNGLELPAGQTVELRPGGNHVMLMDLKQPLAEGTTVPLTLYFADAQGAQSTLALQVPVMMMPSGH